MSEVCRTGWECYEWGSTVEVESTTVRTPDIRKASRLPLSDPPIAFLVTPNPPLSGGIRKAGAYLLGKNAQVK
jgi:hypothetical protein